MSGRAAIHACSLVLAHAPGPRPARLEAGARARRGPRRAARLAHRVRCAPTTTCSATRRTRSSSATSVPSALWEIERPWWRHPVEPRGRGPVRRHRRPGRALPAHAGGRSLRALQARRRPPRERRRSRSTRTAATSARWPARTTSTRASRRRCSSRTSPARRPGALALEHLLRVDRRSRRKTSRT